MVTGPFISDIIPVEIIFLFWHPPPYVATLLFFSPNNPFADESVNENFGTERLARDIKEYTESDIYHAACENGMQKVYKGSVIVVGQAVTGKTHLCRNLLGEDFTENDKVTNGITVSGCVLDKHTADTTFRRQENASKSRSAHVSIKVEENDETIRQIVKESEGHPDVHESVSLWDFGGQYVFYTTHQTFLTWRAVYLLVFDLTKGLNAPVHVKRGGTVKDIKVDIIPSTVGDFLKFWQNSIHVQTKIVDHLGLEYICPKILLVGTHRDKLGHTEEERKKAVEERFSEIQEYLRRRPAHDMHVQPYLYAVNNCDPQDAGIQELRQEICKTIKEQPYWGEEQPLKYVLLEKRLEEIRETQKCLSLDEVLEIGIQHGLVNEEMVIHFLKFYSDLGELVFFNEDNTRNIVILDPQWLIDAFASLITVEKNHKGSSLEAMGYWDLLDDRGELDERLIDIVWKEEAELKKYKAVLLRICQRFDLLVELQEEETDGQWKKYLVPCVLKNHPNPEGYLKIPECPSEGYLEMQKIPPLYLMFDGGFCPPGLFHRLVVCCYRKWSSHDQNPYCNYACFKVDRSTHTILELCNEGDGTIKLMVGSLKKGVNVLERDSAFQVLSYIRQELDRLIGAYFPYLKYSIGFRLPHGLVKLTEDLKTEMLDSDDVCPPGCREVVETAPYRKWLRNNENTICPSASIDVYPPDDMVCDLSRRIGVEWEEVAAYLGVKRAHIDQLKLDNPGNTRGQIRNMLFQWRDAMETSSNEERRDKLKEALARAQRNDLADSLA
ncbi:uncharacterized protein LOC106160033 [Lingula anatina]|uniref:Uncharacterized protein LOC106160033 n=1 Tax=Lingula anatina TaxID=7574 RepID=A0A1S3I143_LINAN|nr:uncharacterized protein LOC106160033 [Lingula anatina]|eukprot:XP_013391980.1 uncharacterized protein LOC106160033 [Lingula anatina]